MFSWDSARTYWASIPAPVRTMLNVVLGAAAAAGVSYLAANIGHPVDLTIAGQTVFVAIATALVRTLNPADASFGVGSSSAPGSV